MAQAKVTEFFSTRKRTRHGVNEDLLIKQVKPDVHTPAIEKQTRSKTKKQEINEAKQEQLALIKTRFTRLDAKLAKSVAHNVEQVAESKAESIKAPAKPKQRLNKNELKQKIEQFNKNLLEIQNEKAQEEKGSASEVEEKVKEAPVQVLETKKDKHEEIPAYLKYKDLATDEFDITTTLTLPKSYSLLLDSYKGSDTIVKFLFNRNELCTFLKLKTGIQNITKHNFTLKHLGQIKTVYPQAYIFKQEKLFVDFKNDFHLIISPNLEEIDVNPETGQRLFTPHVLLKRLAKFKTSLFKIVKKYHQEFLESIGIKDVPFEKLRRWHQKFDLENLKEVEEAELPKPPIDDSIKCKTGQELLSIAKDIYSSRIKEAISKTIPNEETISLEITTETGEKKTTERSKLVVATQSQAKSSISITKSVVSFETSSSDAQVLDKLKEKKESNYNALLEKIRNKEKLKALESMVLNTDKDKKLAKLKNCKEAVRFLAFYFQSEKKSTLEFDKIAKKMSENLKGCSSELECRELLNEMASTSDTFLIENEKKWLNMIKVRNVMYIQMDKSFTMNNLLNLCEKEIEKLA